MALKIIQIGAGLRGSHWLEYVREYSETETVAVVDPAPHALARAKDIINSENCHYFEDLEEALKNHNADAALIASPSHLHAQHARAVLEADLGVMIEKPFAMNVAEAYDIIKLAEKVGKPVMVAENFRYVPAERTIRKLMHENFLEKLHTVTLVDRRRQPAATQGAWVAGMKFAQLQEIAIHHFDSLRSFFNRTPLTIAVQVYNPAGCDYSHGACTKALIEMEGGINITYLGTLTSHRYSYALHIEGEKGDLWTNRKWVLFRKKGGRLFMPLKKSQVPPGDEKAYPREGTTSLLDSFCEAVLNGKEPETCGKDNIWNVAMVQAGMLSEEQQRIIKLSEIMKDIDLNCQD